MEKLNENMTTYKTYIKKIQTLNETINLFSNKSTTIALRKLHQNITNYLNIALQYASTFNFNKSAEMVKKSEEEMTLYLRLINQTLSLLDKIRKLSELVQRINKSTLSEGNKQLLQQAVDMLQEASFKVECGDIEGANNLLKETELLIEKVTSSSEASANSHENYLYILTVILLALSLIVLILKRRKELAGKNSLEQT
jgi:predicted nuclease with TOPRIM domain